jgi:hypothetical protein
MKKSIPLLLIALCLICSVKAQKHNFSIKAGIINCKTKTMQVPLSRFTMGGFDPRMGLLLGGRYNFKLSRSVNTGAELLYILKGNTSSSYGTEIIYSYHYLSLSPYISVFPFVNSESKYISCISPEISFDYNYSLGTNKPWKLFDNSRFYKSELGYTIRLTYQPNKFGIQLFHFRSLSPYYRIHTDSPVVDEYKYSFVSGASLIYKIFPYGKNHKK